MRRHLHSSFLTPHSSLLLREVISMTHQTQEYWCKEAVRISEMMMHGFYEKSIHPKDLPCWISEKSFSWIGAAEGEIYHSLEEALVAYSHQRDMKEVPLIRVGKGKYTAQAITDYVYLVICEVPLTTPPESGLVLSENQRCTMVYHVEKGQLKIVHIHTSNPWTSMKQEGQFPKIAGRTNYEYMQQLVADKNLQHFPDLSDRQKLILELLSQGKTYAAIAKALSISPRTVRYHVGELCHKFHVTNKAELLALSGKKWK